jgi:hypothetical protein
MFQLAARDIVSLRVSRNNFQMLSETYDRGVETGTVEDAGSTNQTLGVLELGLEIRLLLGSASGEGRAIVETLVGGRSRGNGASKGHKSA